MNKQDKEKAVEISGHYLQIVDCFAKKHYDEDDILSTARDAALEMAQWKDEQFSKFLLWLDDYYVIKRFTDGEPMTYAELIDNFKSNSYERNTTKKD